MSVVLSDVRFEAGSLFGDGINGWSRSWAAGHVHVTVELLLR